MLKHPIAQKQTEVLGVILSQLLLCIRQAEDGIGKVILAIVNNGVNVPEFGGGLYNVWGFRVIILHSAGFTRSRVGIKVREALAERLFHVRQGNGLKILISGGTILGKEEIGVAHQITFIGIDDFILIPVRSRKVLCDAVHHIINALP